MNANRCGVICWAYIVLVVVEKLLINLFSSVVETILDREKKNNRNCIAVCTVCSCNGELLSEFRYRHFLIPTSNWTHSFEIFFIRVLELKYDDKWSSPLLFHVLLFSI